MRIKILLLVWFAAVDAIAAPDLLAELGQAKAKWESYGTENYAFAISNKCFCTNPMEVGPLVIVVRGDKIQRTVYAGSPRDGYSYGQAVRRRTPLRITVPKLFQYIEKQLRIHNHSYFKIKYDATDGHPLRIEFDDPALKNEESLILVEKLQRL
ncbi:MAG TPA: DUF6174 domain-containing protein [Gammaproteobacteria bacterium]